MLGRPGATEGRPLKAQTPFRHFQCLVLPLERIMATDRDSGDPAPSVLPQTSDLAPRAPEAYEKLKELAQLIGRQLAREEFQRLTDKQR